MKERVAGADQLEKDYLARLDQAVLALDPVYRSEVVQGVKDHIEEALDEFPEDIIRAVHMTEVLDRLGPPESFIDPSGMEMISPDQETDLSSVGPDGMDIQFLKNLLSRLWMAMLIFVIGLFVPVINLKFCGIIAAILVIVNLRKNPEKQPESFRMFYQFTAVSLILMFFMLTAGCFMPVFEPAVLLAILIGCAFSIVDFLAYWNLMEGLCWVCSRLEKDDLARSIRRKRILYLFYYFGLYAGRWVMLFWLFSAKSGPGKILLYEYLLLAATWVVGYFLILMPISAVKKALCGAGPGDSRRAKEQKDVLDRS